MATLGARLAGFLLLLVAASHMAVAERVVVNVKDEISVGGETKANKAQADTGTPANGPVVTSVDDLRKRLAAEAENARIAEEKRKAAEKQAALEVERLAEEQRKEAEAARIAEEQRKAAEEQRKAAEEQRKAAEEQAALVVKRLAEEAAEARVAKEAKMKAALEAARIFEKEALVKFPQLLPGTWVTNSTKRNSLRLPKYNERWYRIGKSDQGSEWSLPIEVMKGERSGASDVSPGDHVVYTGTEDHGDNNGIAVEVIPDSQVRVRFTDDSEATVELSLLRVIEASTKALGTLTEKDCSRGACCEKTVTYSRRQKSDKKEAALSVKICLIDSSGTVEITEERIKDGAEKSSNKFFIKDQTTFFKVEKTQK